MTFTQPSRETSVYQEPLELDANTNRGCSCCGFSGAPNEKLEALSLELDVLKIDDHINHLHQQKSSKLRRLNVLRSATGDLPSETLLLIFHHVANPIPDPTSLDYCRNPYHRKDAERNLSIIRCASVSSLWRDIILSAPSLWTTLVLNIRTNTVENDREFMKLCWRRSGQLPLAVDLQFIKGHRSTLEPTVLNENPPELLSLMGDEAARVQMLCLHNPPTSWLSDISRSSFHQLQCLSLEGMKNTVPRAGVKLSNLPQLRQLMLKNTRRLIEVPRPCNITVLDFVETSIDACIFVLIQCSNVVEAHCRAPKVTRDSGQAGNILLDKPIILQYLRNFTWSLCDGEINRWLIQHLKLPALNKLQLYGDANCGRAIPTQSVIEFFHRLPSDLWKLELVNWRDWTTGALAQLFDNVCNMKELVLRECFETFTLDVVILLSVREPTYRLGHLPHLSTLSIQSTTVRSYLANLPGLMKQRKGSSEKPFRLEISRPEGSMAEFLELQAALENGCVELGFLDMFVE